MGSGGYMSGASSSLSLLLSSFQRARVESSLQGRKPGDMIRMKRDGFLHYAIYIGKDKIVDFVADNDGEVNSRNLYETVGNSECAIDNYLDNTHRPYSEQTIVQRALNAIAETHIYSLGKYNCEHFATWCRYGYAYCHQPCEVAATLGALVNLSS